MELIERKTIVGNAYALVGLLSKGYDGMMKNESTLGRLAIGFFWQLSGARYHAFIQQTFQGIPKDFAGRLLEVPVGTGVLSLPHYRHMKSADITCLDYSEQMLQQARTAPLAKALTNVDFVQGDVGHLPYGDNAFDCVLSLNGLHAFPDKDAAFQETTASCATAAPSPAAATSKARIKSPTASSSTFASPAASSPRPSTPPPP